MLGPMAHNNLGAALGGNGDWHGEIAEEREALRLNPNNDAAHGSLGVGAEARAIRAARSWNCVRRYA
jgi:hypothetical protein